MPAPEIAGRAIGSFAFARRAGCLAQFLSRRSPTTARLGIVIFLTLYGTPFMQSRGKGREAAATF